MTLESTSDQFPEVFDSALVFQSAETLGGGASDVAPAAGLDRSRWPGGIIVDDFDKNGRRDMVKSSFDSLASAVQSSTTMETALLRAAPPRPVWGPLGGLKHNPWPTTITDGLLPTILVLRAAGVIATQAAATDNCNGNLHRCDLRQAAWGSPPAPKAAVWVDINNTDCSTCRLQRSVPGGNSFS